MDAEHLQSRADPQAQQRLANCTGKRAFSSPQEAHRETRRRRAYKACGVYHCHECGRYHVGTVFEPRYQRARPKERLHE